MGRHQNVRNMRAFLSRPFPNTMICGAFRRTVENLRHLREGPLQAVAQGGWMPPFRERGCRRGGRCRAMATVRAAAKKVSCEDCYFRCNLLCALDLDEPCPTFRPDHPDGLRPPRQLRFTFRQERRTQAAWAFPSAQEQAALHR
jgi:hypothetical protein